MSNIKKGAPKGQLDLWYPGSSEIFHFLNCHGLDFRSYYYSELIFKTVSQPSGRILFPGDWAEVYVHLTLRPLTP